MFHEHLILQCLFTPVLSHRADMDAVAFLEMDTKLPER